MSLSARPEQDDPPPPNADDLPGPTAWMIAGFTLVLAYIIVLALLRPTA